MTYTSPPLALTMGDASGIGPEIVAKVLAEDTERVVVFGSVVVMQDIVRRLGMKVVVQCIESPVEARFVRGTIEVVESTRIVDAPALGEISGIVTAPINKEAMASAGIRYPGHTEILADHGGASRVAMMLANDDIRTVLATVHMSLSKAIAHGTFDAQMSAIRLAHEGGRALGFARPRIAVAGLNPHAGEGGLFGDEEIRIIRPAVDAARAEGIDASGPHPGDTVFMQAREGRFDVKRILRPHSPDCAGPGLPRSRGMSTTCRSRSHF